MRNKMIIDVIALQILSLSVDPSQNKLSLEEKL